MTQAYSTSSISQMRSLLKSTCNYIRAKTHILILDTKVMNNLDTIYANIIAVFVVAAYRMSISIDKLLKLDKKGNKGSRSGYIFRCIRGSIIYGARLIQTRSKKSLLGLEKGAMRKTKTQLLYQHLAIPQRQSLSDQKFDKNKHSLAQQSRQSNGANKNGVQGFKNREAYVFMKKVRFPWSASAFLFPQCQKANITFAVVNLCRLCILAGGHLRTLPRSIAVSIALSSKGRC
jgi:hypothetical protein